MPRIVLRPSYRVAVPTIPPLAKPTTSLSTNGQVILPASIRRRRQRDAGTRLTVEETPDGVLLKAVPQFPPTTPDQVFGSLHYRGKSKSLTGLQQGILAAYPASGAGIASTDKKARFQHGEKGSTTEGHGEAKIMALRAVLGHTPARGAKALTSPWPSVALPFSPC